MTTIIIIVVVALVFFVTVCVVTFMVWKRETEMRTDSIRAIENNLERLGDKLVSEAEQQSERPVPLQDDLQEECVQMPETSERVIANRSRRMKSRDPFGWVRSGPEQEKASQKDMVRQTDEWLRAEPSQQMEPLQQAAQPPDVPDIPEDESQIMPEEEIAAEFAADTEENPPDENIAPEPAEEYDIAEPAADDIASMEIELPDIDMFAGLGTLDVKTEGAEPADSPRQFGHDIGRSGKKYTAEELEMLIKE